jgi:pimeloyl-ACP methyl ester carboxylesterase
VKITDGGGKEVELQIGKYGLQHLICRDLGDSNDHPWFPLAFYQMDKGDYSTLAQLAQRRYRQYQPGTPLLSVVNDAASGASKARLAQVERESKTAIFGNTMNFMDEIADAVGSPDLGDTYRSPIKSSVRTLFLSGTLDWNTPPEQAEAVRKGFSRSTHIIVENAGHESVIPHPAIQQAIVDFFKGSDLSKVKVALPPIKFLPLPD